MGADLIVATLEIPKDKDPDWEAAKRHVSHQPLEKSVEALLEMQQLSSLEELDMTPEDCRMRVLSSVEEVEAYWESGIYRRVVVLDMHVTRVLIAGDRTWGDPIDEVDSVNLFAICGAAHAAGFLDCSTNSVKYRLVLEPGMAPESSGEDKT